MSAHFGYHSPVFLLVGFVWVLCAVVCVFSGEWDFGLVTRGPAVLVWLGWLLARGPDINLAGRCEAWHNVGAASWCIVTLKFA